MRARTSSGSSSSAGTPNLLIGLTRSALHSSNTARSSRQRCPARVRSVRSRRRGRTMILTKKVALGLAGVVAAAVLGTAGVAAATSDNATPTPATSSAPASTTAPGDKASGDRAAERHKIRRSAIVRGMHGEFVVKGKDGKPVTIETIRGTVTAVGSTSVTVKADDGFTETFTANSDTKVKGAVAKSFSEVKVGAKGAVIGVKNGGTTTARMVLVRK